MIPLFKVHIPPGAGEEMVKTLYSGYISEGERVLDFERQMGAWLGNPNVASTNSCTSAIALSLIMCGVGPGCEVIVTPMTCAATIMPIASLGAKIVWADIDPSTGNIDPDDIIRKITDKTKAIIYVHWAGQPADIQSVTIAAKSYGIPVIEDAAHALGAEFKGKKIGNHAEYVTFSFQAIKHISTGDGGLVALNGENIEERLAKLTRIRWFGLDRKFNRSVTKWETDITEVGYKMHMNDLAATLGLSQMKHIDEIIRKHIENGLYFDQHLSDIPGVTLIRRDDRAVNASWIYTVLLDNAEGREKFAKKMVSSGIACNVVHVRNDQYSVFKEFRVDLPGVDDFCSRMINLPCGWWLTEADKKKIVETVTVWKDND